MEQIQHIDYMKSHIEESIDVIHFKTIDSTNDYCKYQIEAQDQPILILADEQTKGRGRLGKSFYSPHLEGLYMSLLLAPKHLVATTNYLNIIAAVAVVEAVKEVYDIELQIKWVNDLFLKNKKVGGILIETMLDPLTNNYSKLIVGIGINLSNDYFPADIDHIAGSLNIDQNSKYRLTTVIINKFMNFYKKNNKEEILSKYKDRLIVLNRFIHYTYNEQLQLGYVMNIDDLGRLIVQGEDGIIQTLVAGEVSIGSEQFTTGNKLSKDKIE